MAEQATLSYQFAPVGEPMAPAVQQTFELAATGGVPQQVLDEARAEAHAAGYATGWASGVAEARAAMAADVDAARDRSAAAERQRAADVARALRALDAAAVSLEAAIVPTAVDVEALTLRLVSELVETALRHELRTGAELRGALALLDLAPVGQPIALRLAEADHAVLAAELAAVSTDREITVLADPQLQPGDAIATCGVTEIDARVAPALARIKDVLS